MLLFYPVLIICCQGLAKISLAALSEDIEFITLPYNVLSSAPGMTAKHSQCIQSLGHWHGIYAVYYCNESRVSSLSSSGT